MPSLLPHWPPSLTPHRDIREDNVSEALFAVNLSRAMAREGAAEYRDPALFFQRTHLTRTLQSLTRDVLNTLRGQPGANSIIHLQTNFGGGKTHAELALYHLLKSPEQALTVPRLADFLAENGFESIPRAEVAALPCADLYAGGRETDDGVPINTLWGEVAYRLGGAELYRLVQDSDQRRTPPGAATLRKVLTQAGPNLILIDEMLHYVDKAAAIPVGNSDLGSQTLAFLRELTEAVDAVPHSVLVVSLTASRMEKITVLTGEQAQFTLSQMEDILRRVEDTRTPIESSEIYEIVRARLFQEVNEVTAEQAATAYSQFYASDPWRDLLPPESRELGYTDLIRRAYPLHPSIIKILYERWGSRPQFQLTRGTLRFLAHLLAYLWKTGPEAAAPSPLIHLSDLPLIDDDVRGETLRVAGSAWETVIGADIAAWEGEAAIFQRIDRERGGLYARCNLVQGIAASVFAFTQGGQQTKPTPRADVRLAVARPDVPLPDLNQAFDDCAARLYYFYEEEGGYLFKTEPNPNKVLADERANVKTDDARLQVERVVPDVMGRSDLFRVSFYGFQESPVKAPGDVPEENRLQLVVLPPRQTLTRGVIAGQAAETMREITANYGKKHRMNGNMVLYMAPDSGAMAGAVDQAMDWLAAKQVAGDKELMERFSETQKESLGSKITTAANNTKDYLRKAYNTVILPAGEGQYQVFSLSYVPPNKTVLEQVEEELVNRGKIHPEFNPALFESRWETLWPKTATVITTQTLWEKFARRGDAPILTGIEVLQVTIRKGVAGEHFGYGLLHETAQDKLKAASYQRVYLGPFDANDLSDIPISHRAVLLRPGQVYALFPPITKEEIAMLLTAPRQTVNAAFQTARAAPTIQGRVDKRAFFTALVEGVKAGLFGYTPTLDDPIQRGPDAELTPDDVAFSGLLIGEDVPLPITADELARLLPAEGRVTVRDLYQQAVAAYGAERVTKGSLLLALQRCVKEGRFGYAPSPEVLIQPDPARLTLDGYVGPPETLPPDTRVLRFRGAVQPNELAHVIKAAMNLSKLGDSNITLDLRLELKGEVNEHSVSMALNELRRRVEGVEVEDVRGSKSNE
ncbi:MAG: ATP-binding protein [Anaerolineales bacterium]